MAMFGLDVTSLLLGAIIFLLVKILSSRKLNLPPSPFSLPILGNVFFLYKYGIHLYRSGDDLARRYGSLVTLKLGSSQLVLILDYDVMKDAYSRPEFAGRLVPFIKREQMLWKNFGVIWSEGHLWLEQRRFALRHLKDFGFGKKSIQGLVREEVQELVEEFKEMGDVFTMDRLVFNMCVFNILWAVVGGKRYDHKDARLLEVMRKVSNTDGGSMVVLSYFPWLRHLLPDSWTGADHIHDKVAAAHQLFGEVISEHEVTYQDDAMRDFTDVFIREMKSRDGDHDGTFTSDQLKVMLYDLFIAGSETTTTTLYWCVLLMVLYPQVQQRVQQELEEVVGHSRLPTLEDRVSLPYVEATILEVQRFSGAVPFPPIHKTTQDTTLNGYDIPKGTGVLANLHYILHDPHYWKDPGQFRPARFLDKSGRLVKDERMVPFGTGKRMCLGESLAKIELFLVFTVLLHQLHFRSPPGESPDMTDISQVDQTAVLVPRPFKCQVTAR